MRELAFVALLALAACSDGADPAKEADAAPAQQLQAGQWEITSEVVTFNQADQGAPKIDTPVGTRETTTHCVAEADVKRPVPALFAATGDSCNYRDIYMSGGRINASIDCTRSGLRGQLMYSVNGSYTATSIDATRDLQTYLTSDGDVRVSSKITGRHVGQCTSGS